MRLPPGRNQRRDVRLRALLFFASFPGALRLGSSTYVKTWVGYFRSSFNCGPPGRRPRRSGPRLRLK
jgi:hypothetical protein